MCFQNIIWSFSTMLLVKKLSDLGSAEQQVFIVRLFGLFVPNSPKNSFERTIWIPNRPNTKNFEKFRTGLTVRQPTVWTLLDPDQINAVQAILLPFWMVETSLFPDHDLVIHRGTEHVGDVSVLKPYRTLDGWTHRQPELLVVDSFVGLFARWLTVHLWKSSICLCEPFLVFEIVRWNLIWIDLMKFGKATLW